MKCDRCNNEATVHETHIVQGKSRESHLCESCAANLVQQYIISQIKKPPAKGNLPPYPIPQGEHGPPPPTPPTPPFPPSPLHPHSPLPQPAPHLKPATQPSSSIHLGQHNTDQQKTHGSTTPCKGDPIDHHAQGGDHTDQPPPPATPNQNVPPGTSGGPGEPTGTGKVTGGGIGGVGGVGGVGGAGGVAGGGGGMYISARSQAQVAGPVCSCCGMTFNVFKHKGLLGCEMCYQAFERVLTPLLSRAHEGGTHHTGKCPPPSATPGQSSSSSSASRVGPTSGPVSPQPQQTQQPRQTPQQTSPPSSPAPPPPPPSPAEIERLRGMLVIAVREERYETAAAIRDKITSMLAITSAAPCSNQPNIQTPLGRNDSAASEHRNHPGGNAGGDGSGGGMGGGSGGGGGPR